MGDERPPPKDDEPTRAMPFGTEAQPDDTFWSDREEEDTDVAPWSGYSRDEPPGETKRDEPTAELPVEPGTEAETWYEPEAARAEPETPAPYDPYAELRGEPGEPERSHLPEISELTFRARAPEPEPERGPEPVRYSKPRAFKPSTLSKRRAATLAAFAEALLPRGGPIAASASDVGAPERLDAALGTWHPEARRRFARALTFFEWQPLFSRSLRRFSKLRPEVAAAALERAVRSRLLVRRAAVDLLKFYVGNQWAASAPVERAIGFDYGCLSADPPRDGDRLEVLQYPQVTRAHAEECDVVVVGSGAGGSVMAKEMAELGLSVVVIEEGGYFARKDFTGPPFERFQRLYRQQGMTAALGTPPIPLPMGMAVGGSTLVNSGTCFRTPYRVLNRWERETRVEGIDGEAMEPFFERVERIQQVKPVPEGLLGVNAAVFRRGVDALGLHGAPIARAIEGCRGCGVCAFGCPSDAKLSTHLTYLPRAQRTGATIYANCRAERILVEDGRARGVVAWLVDPLTRKPAVPLRVRAKVVVIACGAIHTPALLSENAIGNASGQLGRNLRIHPAAGVGAFFDEELRAWRGTLQSYFVSDWHESDDIMIEVTSSVPSIGAGTFPGVGARYKQMLGAYPHMATAGLFVSDTSSGRVIRRRGREPLVTYRLNRRDARRIVQGIVRTAEVFVAAGARAVHTGIPGLGPVRSREELDAVAPEAAKPRALRLSAFHPVGTARMGADPATSVVGPFGEVHGVPGLFVADASVLPGCPTVNPMITIMAFATRTADHLARHGGRYF